MAAVSATPGKLRALALTVLCFSLPAAAAEVAPFYVLSTDGSVVSFETGKAPIVLGTASAGSDLALDATGNFIVATGRSLERVTRTGAVSVIAAAPAGAVFRSVAADADGTFVVADNFGHRLLRVTEGGVVTAVAEYPVPTPTQLEDNVVRVDTDGNYILAHDNDGLLTGVKLFRISRAGAVERLSLGGTIPRGVGSLAFDAGGNYVLTDWRSNLIFTITRRGLSTYFPSMAAGSVVGLGRDPATGNWIVGNRSNAMVLVSADGSTVQQLWAGAPLAGPRAVLVAANAPPPAIAGITNAASFAKDANGDGAAVAPGSLVTIFGAFPGAVQSPTSVTFNGVRAPVIWATESAISAQAPFSAQPGSADVVVNVNGVASAALRAKLTAVAPGIFTVPPDGQSRAIVVSTDPADNQPKLAPVPRGGRAYFYATGLGRLTPPVADGDGGLADGVLQRVEAAFTVRIGGRPAAIEFAGQAPGFPGVNQISVVVPIDAPAGDAVSLQIETADGAAFSNVAKMAIR